MEIRLLFIGNFSNMRANQEKNQKILGLLEYIHEIEYMKTVILLLNKYTANMNLKQSILNYEKKNKPRVGELSHYKALSRALTFYTIASNILLIAFLILK